MKTIKYLLLVLLCYCTAQVYSQNKAVLGPGLYCISDSCDLESGPEWKQRSYENPAALFTMS